MHHRKDTRRDSAGRAALLVACCSMLGFLLHHTPRCPPATMSLGGWAGIAAMSFALAAVIEFEP